jgi:hypothetical protein
MGRYKRRRRILRRRRMEETKLSSCSSYMYCSVKHHYTNRLSDDATVEEIT